MRVSVGQVVDLNVGELQMYGTVNWLNASDDLGKMKKGIELLTLLFIFKTGVVLMAQERIKGKRKPRVSLHVAVYLLKNVAKNSSAQL